MENEVQNKQKSSIKDYFAVGEIFTYFFRKKGPGRKTDLNLRMMHGINKFAIIAFLLGVIYFIIKLVFIYQ